MILITNGKLVFPGEVREGSLLIEGDQILRIFSSGEIPSQKDFGNAEVIDAGGLYVGPGLIDPHVHGYSCGQENYDILRDLRSVCAAHLRHGTTTLLPSPSYSLRLDGYLDVIRQAVELIAEGGTTVAGIHLEGPYINPHMGAGRKYAWKYSDEVFERLFSAAQGHVLHCTYAPEMPWAKDVERILQKHGVVMDIGHTQASPEEIERAVKAGVRIVTHLFDGMGNYRGIHAADLTGDPQDCVSDVVLGIPDLYYELICDSRFVHTTRNSQRLAYRVAGEDHIILISDATCYNRRNYDPSDFPPEDLRSAPDLNVTDAGTVFGSRLTVAQCAKNFKNNLGLSVRETFKCASTNASKVLGLDGSVGSLSIGKKANLVFTDETFEIKNVMFEGGLQRRF